MRGANVLRETKYLPQLRLPAISLHGSFFKLASQEHKNSLQTSGYSRTASYFTDFLSCFLFMTKLIQTCLFPECSLVIELLRPRAELPERVDGQGKANWIVCLLSNTTPSSFIWCHWVCRGIIPSNSRRSRTTGETPSWKSLGNCQQLPRNERVCFAQAVGRKDTRGLSKHETNLVFLTNIIITI